MNFEQEYMSADSNLSMIEKELTAALEKLAIARADKRADEVTKLRMKAQALERDTEAMLEECFAAHCAYWRDVAIQTEQELGILAGPLLAKINVARWASGAAVHSKPGLSFIQRLDVQGLPKCSPDGPVPLVFSGSKALDRSEKEI